MTNLASASWGTHGPVIRSNRHEGGAGRGVDAGMRIVVVILHLNEPSVSHSKPVDKLLASLK